MTRVDEQALRTRPLTPPARMVLLLLKTAAGNPRLAEELRQWAEELRAVLHQPGGREDLVALLTYIELVGEAPTSELHDLFTDLGSEAEEVYMTTAEMLRAEGRVEGRAEVLLQQLAVRFGPLPADTVQLVRTASVDQLETWTTRVLTAPTLAEALR